MVPVLDVRIVQILNNHALAVGRVDAGLVAGEAACLVHGRLTRAVGLRVASQVDVGAALFLGEAVAGFGDRVGTCVALIFDHSLSSRQPCEWFEDGWGEFLRKVSAAAFGTAMAEITEAKAARPRTLLARVSLTMFLLAVSLRFLLLHQ